MKKTILNHGNLPNFDGDKKNLSRLIINSPTFQTADAIDLYALIFNNDHRDLVAQVRQNPTPEAVDLYVSKFDNDMQDFANLLDECPALQTDEIFGKYMQVFDKNLHVITELRTQVGARTGGLVDLFLSMLSGQEEN